MLEIYGHLTHRRYTYGYLNRKQRTIDAVCSVAQKGAHVLDIAAAQGNFSLTLAELGYEITWNDLRDELAQYVALKHESGIIHYAPGNAFELGLHEKFDVVLITEVTEHVAHSDDFLDKVSSLVKPGGHVIMTTPNGSYFRNKLPKFSECPDASQFESIQFQPDGNGHIFLLHIHEIAPLSQKSGLKIKELRLFTNPLTTGHLKMEGLLKVIPKVLVDRIKSYTAALPEPWSNKINTHMIAVFEKAVH